MYNKIKNIIQNRAESVCLVYICKNEVQTVVGKRKRHEDMIISLLFLLEVDTDINILQF